MIPGFDSLADFGKFYFAREYWRTEDPPTKCDYEKNITEKLGNALIIPSYGTADSVLKNIKSPVFIIAVAVAAAAGCTFLWYPEETSEIILNLIPCVKLIQPWMVKFAGYIGTQLTIAGFGLRALGRLCNDELMVDWRNRMIVPIPIGAVILEQGDN